MNPIPMDCYPQLLNEKQINRISKMVGSRKMVGNTKWNWGLTLITNGIHLQ